MLPESQFIKGLIQGLEIGNIHTAYAILDILNEGLEVGLISGDVCRDGIILPESQFI